MHKQLLTRRQINDNFGSNLRTQNLSTSQLTSHLRKLSNTVLSISYWIFLYCYRNTVSKVQPSASSELPLLCMRRTSFTQSKNKLAICMQHSARKASNGSNQTKIFLYCSAIYITTWKLSDVSFCV